VVGKLGFDPVPQLRRDDRLMFAGEVPVAVADLADVNPVGEQMRERAAAPRDAAPLSAVLGPGDLGDDALASKEAGNSGDAEPGCAHDCRRVRADDDVPPAFPRAHGTATSGCEGGSFNFRFVADRHDDPAGDGPHGRYIGCSAERGEQRCSLAGPGGGRLTQ
jgi:hypothetical protein